MKRACATYRKQMLEGALAPSGSSSHAASCASCRSLTDTLRATEEIVRSETTALPDGFSDKVARVAIARPRRATTRTGDGLLDRLIPVAVPTAALSVVCALALAFVAGWNSNHERQPLEDPLSDAVDLPETLSDPTLALLGGDE